MNTWTGAGVEPGAGETSRASPGLAPYATASWQESSARAFALEPLGRVLDLRAVVVLPVQRCAVVLAEDDLRHGASGRLLVFDRRLHLLRDVGRDLRHPVRLLGVLRALRHHFCDVLAFHNEAAARHHISTPKHLGHHRPPWVGGTSRETPSPTAARVTASGAEDHACAGGDRK